jgi:thiosulfate/3-mercaptopyruvate sulfurtransferase
MRAEYDAGHIPGAIWMGWEEWCEQAPAPERSILRQPGYWGVLRHASATWYAHRLSAAGVNLQRPLAVYSNGVWSRGREGRIAWMLLYLGAHDVALLDGGWQAWCDSGCRLEGDPELSIPARNTVTFQPERRRSVEQIFEGWHGGHRPLLVDTRSRLEFDGGMQEYLPRRGRLPGAVLVPFTSLFDNGGRYIDRETYERLVPPPVLASNDVVAYCEVGVRAGVFALLHEIYTGDIMPVCDGSLVEWSVRSQLPVDSAAPPTRRPEPVTHAPESRACTS